MNNTPNHKTAVETAVIQHHMADIDNLARAYCELRQKNILLLRACSDREEMMIKTEIRLMLEGKN